MNKAAPPQLVHQMFDLSESLWCGGCCLFCASVGPRLTDFVDPYKLGGTLGISTILRVYRTVSHLSNVSLPDRFTGLGHCSSSGTVWDMPPPQGEDTSNLRRDSGLQQILFS